MAASGIRPCLKNRSGVLAAALAVLCLAGAALAQEPEPIVEPEVKPPTQGTLTVTTPEGGTLECPLKHTSVSARIAGFMAEVWVRQHFHNPFPDKIEAVYTFPLPEDSAVDQMIMIVGQRDVYGEIHERERARYIYEQARAAGKRTALLEQERPNIFTQSVANIQPGEEIVISIHYVQPLKYDAGTYSYHFPMVVGPRFIPGAPAGKTGTGWAPDTDAVPDASRITPPVLKPGYRTGHDISLEVTLDAGVPIKDVRSKSHDVLVSPSSEAGVAHVKLKEEDSIPNKDFMLSYKVAGNRPRSALLTHRTQAGGYFLLMLQPSIDNVTKEYEAKEMFFVLDCSGSMRGFPIQKSMQAMVHCIRGIGPADTFQIIRFSSNASRFSPKPIPSTFENKRKALEYVDGLSGSGGTRMIEGIKSALDYERDPERRRYVFFLTDGKIGNEDQIFAAIKEKLGDARIFSFGIGSSTNRHLIEGMALAGNGVSRFVRQDEEAAGVITDLYGRLARPYLKDVTVECEGVEIADLYPKPLPDLLQAQPLLIFGTYEGSGPATVTVGGVLNGEPYEEKVVARFPEWEPENTCLASTWARQKIQQLTFDQLGQRKDLGKEITQLALEFHLMSRYTSFVAVDEVMPDTPDTTLPRLVAVPVPMPEGVSFEGVFGPPGRYPGGVVVDETLEKAERDLAVHRDEAARKELERELERIEAASPMRRARQLADVYSLKNAGQYKEALKVLNRIKYERPTDIAPRLMEKDVDREGHERAKRDLRRVERELVLERSIPYSAPVGYPDASLWYDVIAKRDAVMVPDVPAKLTEKDIEVMQHLDETFALDFEDTDMRTVVRFLQEVTAPLKYSLETRDLNIDGNPITLRVKTKLRLALDEICALSGLGWKVKDGIVKIAHPERLKEYDVRVYDVKDLLVGAEEHTGGAEGGLSEGRPRDGDGTEGAAGSREALLSRADALRLLIMQTVRPETWEAAGEPADIWAPPVEGDGALGAMGPRGRIYLRSGAPRLLIIRQTDDVHEEIRELLQDLRGGPTPLTRLQSTEKPDAELLDAASKDRDVRARMLAAWAFVEDPKLDAPQVLGRLLGDEHPAVLAFAAKAAGAVRNDPARADRLAEILLGADPEKAGGAVLEAAIGLALIAGKHEEARPAAHAALLGALDREYPDGLRTAVLVAALKGLEGYGQADGLERFRKLMGKEQALPVRLLAYERALAQGRMGVFAVYQAISDDAELKGRAELMVTLLQAIAALGYRPMSAMPAPPWGVDTAAWALGQLRSGDYADQRFGLVRVALVENVFPMLDEERGAYLIGLLRTDREWRVRRAVLAGLAARGDTEDYRKAIDLAIEDPHPVIKQLAVAGLVALKAPEDRREEHLRRLAALPTAATCQAILEAEGISVDLPLRSAADIRKALGG